MFIVAPRSKSWRRRLARAGYAIEGKIDVVKARLYSERDVYVRPYRWYASAETITLRGRILRDNGLLASQDDDSLWDNLLNSYRRFNSDELAYGEFTVAFGDQTQTAQADEEGYFDVELPLEKRLAAGWHSAELSLADGAPVSAPFLVVGDSAEYGIISDVDDTILQTHATNLLRVAQLTFLGNARTRLTFPGVAALYHALSKNGRNPLFYVSSSPWNLYDLLNDFIDMQGIPAGPMALRDLGIDRNKLITTGHGSHKLANIERILNTYPALPFILIGDSGQEDPEIYSDVAHRYPGRIQAIYIRDVSDGVRDVAVEALSQSVREMGTDMFLIPDSLLAAEHAARKGWVAAETVRLVSAEIETRDDLLAL